MCFILFFVLITFQLLPTAVWSCEILATEKAGSQYFLLAEEQLRPRPREGKGRSMMGRENVWAIEFKETQDFCFSPKYQEEIILWRKSAKEEIEVQVAHIQGDNVVKKSSLLWKADKHSIPLPAELSFNAESSVLKIYFDDLLQEVHLFMMPAHLQNTTQMVDWMQEKGCVEQASMLREIETEKDI